MTRLWLYFGLACSCALVSGCSVRSVEGQWRGQLPAIAGSDSCRIRLHMGDAFDFLCKGQVRRDGAGSYRFENDILLMQIRFLAENGRTARAEFGPMRFDVSGPGNRITLAPEIDGRPIEWERVAP